MFTYYNLYSPICQVVRRREPSLQRSLLRPVFQAMWLCPSASKARLTEGFVHLPQKPAELLLPSSGYAFAQLKAVCYTRENQFEVIR